MANARENVDVVVAIPVGPREHPAYVLDTVESIRYYTAAPNHVVLIDDAQGTVDLSAVAALKGVTVRKTPPRRRNRNTFGSLFINLCEAYRFILDTFEFKALLRIDVDGLMVGPNPFEDVLCRASESPTYGLFGSFKINGQGKVCDWVIDRTLTAPAMRPRRSLRYPKELAKWLLCLHAYRELERHIAVAEAHGYAVGDFVAGGLCYWTREGLERTLALAQPFARHCRLVRTPEDYLLTVFAFAAGLQPQEYGRPGDPTAINLGALPFSPEEILERELCVIHSTRGYRDMDEDAVRAFFRNRRV